MKNFVLLFLVIISICFGKTQTVLTLQPDPSSGKDAVLHGLSSQRNLNFGSNQQFVANAWTFSGEEAQIRSVIDFNLSSIPASATILSAYLQLFAWDSNSGMGQHSTESGENSCILQRITSDWNEQTITWDNQPTTTMSNQIEIPYSYYATQNYILDVTKLISDSKNNPNESFGFMLKLKNETSKRRMNFASSDHPNPQLRPKLIIVFSSVSNSNCLILQPSPESGKDALLHGLSSEINKNFGTNPQFIANAWTFGGEEAKIRSIIDFEISKLPKNIEIENAFLSLYSWASNTGMGVHSTESGSNECWIERVISDWNESLVTWNNQPTTTTNNRISIDKSNDGNQSYILDVTNLVKDYYNDQSHSFGLMIKLKSEISKRRMNFASSDHENANLRPKLLVTYKSTVKTKDADIVNFEIYPNPASSDIFIDSEYSIEDCIIKIYNLNGTIEYKDSNYQKGKKLNIDSLSKGLYILNLKNDSINCNKKLLIQ